MFKLRKRCEIMSKKRNPLSVLFFTILIDMLGIGVLIPVFPLLIMDSSPFKVIPEGWSSGQGLVMLGFLTAIYPLGMFLFSPLLGQLSDRFGRKKILAISICGTAVAYLLFAVAIYTRNIPLLFISRLVDGVTGGNISVAQAAIGDISTPENRAKNFGLIGMAFGLGFIIGPFLGGQLSNPNLVSWFDAATPFIFTAILSFINMYLVIRNLPETLKEKSTKPINYFRPLENLKMAFVTDGLKMIIPSVFFMNFGFTFFTSFMAVTLAERYGFTQGNTGNFFAYMGIMIVFAQGVVVRSIGNKIADYKILRFSYFGMAFCLLSYFLVPSSMVYLIYFIPPFQSTFNSLSNSFANSLIVRVTPANVRGETMGVASSVSALAMFVPGLFTGAIAAHFSINTPMLVGAILVFMAGVCFNLLFKPGEFVSAK